MSSGYNADDPFMSLSLGSGEGSDQSCDTAELGRSSNRFGEDKVEVWAETLSRQYCRPFPLLLPLSLFTPLDLSLSLSFPLFLILGFSERSYNRFDMHMLSSVFAYDNRCPKVASSYVSTSNSCVTTAASAISP